MVLDETNILDSKSVGPKAVKLKELKELGFNVPKFLILDTNKVYCLPELDKQSLLDDICKKVNAKHYAVRSAALLEDGQDSAMAGQFLTRLRVDRGNLVESILEVRDHSINFLKRTGDLSIIVQAYIEPEYAGVAFSRNPNGDFGGLVNYIEGSGEAVVGGKDSKTILLHKSYLSDLPFYQDLLVGVSRLENYYNKPQDVEWVYAKGILYFIQTRPITTIDDVEFEAFKYLDEKLPEISFYFEQSPLSENFGRPTPLAKDILDYLYRDGGAVHKAYKEMGISYQDNNQHVLLGNQLYVDKQREVKTLLPSMGYMKTKDGRVSFENLNDYFRTLKNTLVLNFLPTRIRPPEEDKLRLCLNEDWSDNQTLTECLNKFDEIYPLIFKINTKCQLAWGRLLKVIGSQERLLELVSLYSEYEKIEFDYSNFEGNSVSIDDVSKFSISNNAINSDLKSVLSFKEKSFLPRIKELSKLVSLRERGRWLTVKLISQTRKSLQREAVESLYKYEDFFFFTIDEIGQKKLNKRLLEARKKDFQKFSKYNLPKVIANFKINNQNEKLVIIAPGEARGTLVYPEDLDAVSGDKLILVEYLSPDLTKHFENIKGIITYEGGILSHLAIMAREQGLPIVKINRDFLIEIGSIVELKSNQILVKGID